jgi:hypothetical protein
MFLPRAIVGTAIAEALDAVATGYNQLLIRPLFGAGYAAASTVTGAGAVVGRKKSLIPI